MRHLFRDFAFVSDKKRKQYTHFLKKNSLIKNLIKINI